MFIRSIVPATLGAFALLAPVVNSHMIMNSPKPYNYNTDPYVEVNPLDGTSFKYPCQGRGFLADTEITTVEAGGAALPVNFTGTATHGGGSCQFSISYEDPNAVGGWTPDFKFKVIYSLIGGCPANSVGNIQNAGFDNHGRVDGVHCGNDSGNECVRQFLIPFPSFLKNGRATFSWTWHNRIGNREIYQNCAPIIITGGTEDQAQIDALPDIFLGNVPAIQSDIPGHTFCTTGQNQTVNYPNPGVYGRVLEDPTDPADYTPSAYCYDIRPASVLPSFQADPRTQYYDSTVTTTLGLAPTGTSSTASYFVTIPNTPVGGGPGETDTTSYGSTVTVTVPVMEEESTMSYASTVTVTLVANTTVTICGPISTGLDGDYGPGSGGGETTITTAPTEATTSSEPSKTTTTHSQTLPDFTDPPVMFTETFHPQESEPVMSTWIQPCGSTKPTPGDLTACWH